MQNPVIDVFLSYASVDAAHADRLAAALERAGVSMWRDTQRIEAFDAIQPVIAEGLSRSKALLALYSINYTKRRACDWELAAAYVAGGAERVLVVNPEAGTDHIQPQTLRERRLAVLTGDTDLDALAQMIKAAVDKLDAPLGALPKPADDQAWIGLSRHGGAHRFVGRRAEIWQVHDGLAAGSVLLAPTTSGPAPGDGTAMLRGLGGVGKSLLAGEYARRFAAAWPGGIFWLRAGGGESRDATGQLFGQRQMLADKLGIPQQPNPDALERALAQAMAARPGPYLWVVDDLPYGLSSGQVRQWLAPSGQGRTLITTRDRGVDGIARLVDLAELMQEEALRLLTLNRLPASTDEDAAAAEIVELLGRHALAVDLARHLVERRGYAQFLADLRDPGREALELAAQMRLELPNDHEKSIAGTLLQSIRLLSPPALDTLRLASVLAPHEPIPEDLLAAVIAQAAGKKVTETDSDAVFLAIDEVQSHSLCETRDGRYTVHALVCRTVALGHADNRSGAIREATLNILRRVMFHADDIRYHKLIFPLVPHVWAIVATPRTEAETILLGKVGLFLYVAGLYSAAEAAYAVEHSFNKSLLGQEDPGTMSSMGNLALAIKGQGRLNEAQKIEEELVIVRRKVLGKLHPDTLISLNNLAVTYVFQGELSKALPLQEEALEVRRKVLGQDDETTISSMVNLSETLARCGEFTRARTLLEEAYLRANKEFGRHHQLTIGCLGSLALVYKLQGLLVEARRLEEDVLDLRCKVLWDKHPHTLTAMSNLAVTLLAMGEHTEAQMLLEKVVIWRRSIQGQCHPDTYIATALLGEALALRGDTEAAHLLMNAATVGLVKAMGHNHPEVIAIRSRLDTLNSSPPPAPSPD